jgi:hypothetical protein
MEVNTLDITNFYQYEKIYPDVNSDCPYDFFIQEFRGFLRFQTDKYNMVTGFNLNGMMAKKIE